MIPKAFAIRQIGDDDDQDNGGDDDHNDGDDLVIDCLHWDHLVVPLTGTACLCQPTFSSLEASSMNQENSHRIWKSNSKLKFFTFSISHWTSSCMARISLLLTKSFDVSCKKLVCSRKLLLEHGPKWILIQLHLNLSHSMVYLCRGEILRKTLRQMTSMSSTVKDILFSVADQINTQEILRKYFGRRRPLDSLL